MPQPYCIYVLGDDGHFQRRVDLVCENDARAKDKAEQMLDGQSIEIWQSARRVLTLHPEVSRESDDDPTREEH
ncbi:MAG TPA: hypothetical protein VFL62_08580 [Bradyrhizobium sp.]|uniref:hypothetical protein n=1 Tax=Bradyrhizobium sp. TaxID=376 RepID=UPI002D7E6771|nr:hypothetical protein [Bradyrhizobium sp.]HET7886266.1 hypothetical protein [Bradyrhizobium sp.]